ncbi:hypothetical protein BJV82DRAFT_603687 [Fennellomyces sp. T-0311]|nr:hypothetical protein BJV82DRAFT_603687 [Fennellomyces sp. T-0311]
MLWNLLETASSLLVLLKPVVSGIGPFFPSTDVLGAQPAIVMPIPSKNKVRNLNSLSLVYSTDPYDVSMARMFEATKRLPIM